MKKQSKLKSKGVKASVLKYDYLKPKSQYKKSTVTMMKHMQPTHTEIDDLNFKFNMTLDPTLNATEQPPTFRSRHSIAPTLKAWPETNVHACQKCHNLSKDCPFCLGSAIANVSGSYKMHGKIKNSESHGVSNRSGMCLNSTHKSLKLIKKANMSTEGIFYCPKKINASSVMQYPETSVKKKVKNLKIKKSTIHDIQIDKL
jgi:hypothetical protein